MKRIEAIKKGTGEIYEMDGRTSEYMVREEEKREKLKTRMGKKAMAYEKKEGGSWWQRNAGRK